MRKEMVTKNDVDLMRKEMATKTDLTNAVDDLKNYMEQFTVDGVDAVVQTLDEMFPERTFSKKPRKTRVN